MVQFIINYKSAFEIQTIYKTLIQITWNSYELHMKIIETICEIHTNYS
jgi:hypothetical protein